MTEKTAEKTLTGIPSVDRVWMKYYPEEITQLTVPECTLREYMLQNCPGLDISAIHYYGNDIVWRTIFEQADMVAKALRAFGFQEGDQIPVFIKTVPKFVFLLLAAEKIGASLLCRDNTIPENADAIKKSNSKTIFAHTFLSKEEMASYQEAGAKYFVLLSPYNSAGCPDTIAPHNRKVVQSLYPECAAVGEFVMSWNDFLKIGENFTGAVEAPADYNRPLFRAYTSGSTGPSKQVILSARNMIAVLHQMCMYSVPSNERLTWLVTILPPCLIAVVVSIILSPMVSGKLLIMDPFVEVDDIDLEIMHYKPNFWPQIPMFIERLMLSKRIPDDYDMSHLKAAGAGCEAYNNCQIQRAQQFLHDHNCKVNYTTGYGQSEAGSSATLPFSPYPVRDGNIGIPMPLNTIGIFVPGTQEELGYNTPGEICIAGPGNMLGYDDPVKTAKALQTHADGKVWVHTGDLGYINEDGVVFTMGRGNAQRYGGGHLCEITMENRLADARIPGISDEFFLTVIDPEHPDSHVPYLYLILEDGYTIADVESAILAALLPHERPVKMIQLSERPFFHFKTNRVGLKKDIMNQTI